MSRISRRTVLHAAGVGALAAPAVSRLGAASAAATDPTRDPRAQWLQLEPLIRQWWRDFGGRADEAAVRADPNLLFLPFPTHGFGTALPGWDTYFANLGLLAHGLSDFVKDHVLDQLFLIERYGYVPNGNQLAVLTRSHPPLWPEGIRRYLQAGGDRDVAMIAYPQLVREYTGYWSADHHSTPIGLTTNRDLGDPGLSPILAAEAETGLDFTPIFGGDVRRCAPIQTNVLLANYEQVLAWLAAQVGRAREAAEWQRKRDQRVRLIQQFCWDAGSGFFFEYDYVAKKSLPYWSLCAYWAMWAGIATPAQAAQLVAQLPKFERDYGVTMTDRSYPDPHQPTDPFWCQWQYPTGWPNMQMMVVEALQRYGYRTEAKRIAKKYVDLMTDLFFNRGATDDITGNRNTSDSAPKLTGDHTAGQTFSAPKSFTRAGGRFATYTTTGAGMRLTLRRGGPEGDPVVSSRFDDVYDNSWLYAESAQPLPAGEYYLEQSEPAGTIAWYSSSKDAYAAGSAYVDGAAVAGDRVFAVEAPGSGGTNELWEKYNVVEGNLDLPPSHYGEIWTDQGWSYGAAAVLGRLAYGE
ncbi:MAG TPA: trehalase family glycosidase [Mycobacteriales bacterium]|nr:trehalase family glycosidase [Mycobacteriales bacterium]